MREEATTRERQSHVSDLPDPMTPVNCDLRGYEFMPLFGHRLFNSEFDAKATDAEFRAAMNLWWAAWLEVPAASLPDDDVVLTKLAGLGRDKNAWMGVRKMALHGFVKCSEGRLYHRTLAPEAVDAFTRRIKSAHKRDADRERLRLWREARNRNVETRVGNDQRASDETTTGSADETQTQTHDETRVGNADETRVVAGRQDRTGQDKTEKKKEREESPLTPRLVLMPAPAIAPDIAAEFDEWWKAYPRKEGKGQARNAYRTARRKTSSAVLLIAVQSRRFPANPKYIPHPTTWLNGERWLDEQDNTDPVLRACGLTADGRLAAEQPSDQPESQRLLANG